MLGRTIVVVDDHDILRSGIRDFLVALPGYEVVGEAGTAREAFQVIEAVRPDVVLMDIAMPGLDGVIATREVLRRVPRTHVLILSAHGQVYDVKDALNAGAIGYVLKGDEPEELTRALDNVVRGVRYLSPGLRVGPTAIDQARSSDDILGVLSEREREIFRLAADCRTASEIAGQLCISRKTVDTHLNRINRKLQLRDRAGLVRLAVTVGLVHSLSHRKRAAPVRGAVDGLVCSA